MSLQISFQMPFTKEKSDWHAFVLGNSMKLRHSAEEEEEQFCQMCLQRNVQGIEHLHQMAVVRSSLQFLLKRKFLNGSCFLWRSIRMFSVLKFVLNFHWKGVFWGYHLRKSSINLLKMDHFEVLLIGCSWNTIWSVKYESGNSSLRPLQLCQY